MKTGAVVGGMIMGKSKPASISFRSHQPLTHAIKVTYPSGSAAVAP